MHIAIKFVAIIIDQVSLTVTKLPVVEKVGEQKSWSVIPPVELANRDVVIIIIIIIIITGPWPVFSCMSLDWIVEWVNFTGCFDVSLWVFGSE